MDSSTTYYPPLALTIISSISIGLGGLAALWIALDIVRRRGWKSMMAIMMPVYIVNALYLWPITLWTYLNYGRPAKLQRSPSTPIGKSPPTAHQSHANPDQEGGAVHGHCSSHSASHNRGVMQGENVAHAAHDGHKGTDEHNGHRGHGGHCGTSTAPGSDHVASSDDSEKGADGPAGHGGHHCHSGGGERPMFATITVAVCHCGAGCVIGDIIGEWIVYGADVTIDGRTLWPAYLIDFVFAIALGIVFQYYSIAPMAGNYSPKILWRAAKADFFSLLFFEIGLFGWMAIFQIAIFHWKLEMNTVTYWWMMQIGMFLGHWTGVPINWWLIKTGVKEPCA